jgi:DNA-binding NarL/FixJ family response regulator
MPVHSVVLIDHQPLVLDSLRALLSTQPDLRVAACVSSVLEVMPAVEGAQPDVVVFDVDMPAGPAVLRRLVRAHSWCRVLAVGPDEVVADAMNAGARGYALKSQSGAEFLEAVRIVAGGHSYLAPKLEVPLPPEVVHPLQSLTSREREVFQLMIAGTGTRDAAQQLRLSPRTIETHRSRVLQKLDARSVADLVRMAARWGMLETG